MDSINKIYTFDLCETVLLVGCVREVEIVYSTCEGMVGCSKMNIARRSNGLGTNFNGLPEPKHKIKRPRANNKVSY